MGGEYRGMVMVNCAEQAETWHSAGVRELRLLLSIDMPPRWGGEWRPGGRGISIAVVNHSLDQHLTVDHLRDWLSECDETIGKRQVSIDIALRCSAGSRDLEVVPAKGWCAVHTLRLLNRDLEIAPTYGSVEQLR